MGSSCRVPLEVVYALFYAVNKKLGDEAWDIIWEAARVLFEDIRSKKDIRKEDSLEDALSKLREFLIENGLLKDLIIKYSEDFIDVEMVEPVFLQINQRLREEGMVPCRLIFPLIHLTMEYVGYKPLLLMDREVRGNVVLEKWKIVKAEAET